MLPVGAFLSWRLAERQLHQRNLNRIPLRVHVNGTRGKSQTVELIVSGLQATGMHTAGKITGILPTFIAPNGHRSILSRRGPASIAEQLGVVRRAAQCGADALIVECNAIEPELQRASQDMIVQAQIGVITNVRQDHMDVLGPSEEETARALAMTIPAGGTLVTREEHQLNQLREMANARGASCVEAPSPAASEMSADCAIPHWIRRDNLELALTVCEIAGADLATALEGMLHAVPPRAAWCVRRVTRLGQHAYFLNAFSANDPESTERLIRETADRLGVHRSHLVVFNHRADRSFRLDSFTPLLTSSAVERLFLIGDHVPRWRRRFPHAVSFAGKPDTRWLLDQLLDEAPPGVLIVGMGNIGGPGLELVDLLEKLGEEV